MNALKNNLLPIVFFIFFASYSQYTINNLDRTALLEKVIELKKSQELQGFMERAQRVNVSSAKIDSIIYAKLVQDYRIAALKKHAKGTNKSFLINITDSKFDKNSIIRAYRKTISSLLTKNQFQFIYKELLDLQIEREAPKTLADLKKEYLLKKPSDIEVISKWVQQYTSTAVLEQQYYAYDKKLSQTKYGAVLKEAADKYVEVLLQLEVLLVNPLPVQETPEELFIEKANSVGVNSAIANRIIELSKNTRSQIKAIEKQNKSNAPHIYLLETTKNSKDGVRKEFKKRLAQLISIQQFKKLFGDQLNEDIQEAIAYRMKQITSVYTLNETQYKDMESLVADYVTKDLLIQHYYGYDKKVKKQKQKVAKFKFDSAYKKKIQASL